MEGLCPERRALERRWGKRRQTGGGRQSGLKEGKHFIQGGHVGIRVAFVAFVASVPKIHEIVFEEIEQEKFQQLIVEAGGWEQI